VIWLAYIVTEGDHRQVSVETYLKGMQRTLIHVTAQIIERIGNSNGLLAPTPIPRRAHGACGLLIALQQPARPAAQRDFRWCWTGAAGWIG
jgi:hypothetical protein